MVDRDILYLVECISEGVLVDEREANEEDVGVGVAEGPESLIVVLSGRVPASEGNDVLTRSRA